MMWHWDGESWVDAWVLNPQPSSCQVVCHQWVYGQSSKPLLVFQKAWQADSRCQVWGGGGGGSCSSSSKPHTYLSPLPLRGATLLCQPQFTGVLCPQPSFRAAFRHNPSCWYQLQGLCARCSLVSLFSTCLACYHSSLNQQDPICWDVSEAHGV